MNAVRVILALIPMTCVMGCKQKANTYVPPPPPEVTVATVTSRMLPDTLEATALTRGFEEVEVRARVKGFLEKKFSVGGVRVKKGDPLFRIDPREYEATVKEAEADLVAKSAAADLAEVTLGRVLDAFAQQAAAQFEVDKATAERDAAKARVELAKATLTNAKLNLEFTDIRAPISGRMSIVTVDEGQLVGASDPTLLATIINDSKVYAAFDIDERRLLELRQKTSNRRPGEDGSPNLEIRLGLANETGFPHIGKFDKSDNTVKSSTGTIQVDAVFDNSDGTILSGLFARAQAIFEEREVTLVPEVAVQMDQSGRYVYSVENDGEVRRVNVTVGTVIDGMRRINSGLEPGAKVIVAGIQRARPGIKVTTKAVESAPSAAPAPAPTTGGTAK